MSPALIWIAVAAAHAGLSVLALRGAAAGSRRLLAATLCATVPLGGPVLALMVRRVSGLGPVLGDEADAMPPARPDPADVLLLADLPPIVDRLTSADPLERQSAMLQLIDSGDAQAMALLHWVVEHGSPEVVLEAALALDELDRRQLIDAVALPG
jgi:hypothetical protein